MGKIKYDKIMCVDLEATCWDNEHQPQPIQPMEIIEVGFALLNLTDGVIDGPHSILVKPLKSKVSQFCEDLTGHTQQELDEKGVSLKQAGRILMEEYKSKKYVWCSWGDYDRNQYKKDCQDTDWYPFSYRHINLKTIYALHFLRTKEYGLASALRYLKFEFEGRPHNGGDDAYNTAKIAREMYFKQ